MNTLILPAKGEKLYQISRNIKGVKTLDPKALNVYDLLKYRQILIEKESVALIEKHYNVTK